MKNSVTILLVVVLFNACGRKEQATSPTIQLKLDSYFHKFASNDQPGGAVILVKNDSVIYSTSFGVADIQTKEPITINTLFNVGSISKTFVANGILLLQMQGKLSVEDSLLKYFPNFKNKEIAKKVKIKHLLTHTSGLPDNRQVDKDTVFYLTAKDEENWYPVTQTDTLSFEPGSRYTYSNPAFNALALIIEQVSGVKWQTFIKENIMSPAGMTQSTITDGPYPESGVSHGYVYYDGKWVEDDYGEEPTFAAAGNGGVWSSVSELVLYERAIKESKFLNKEVINGSRTTKEFPNWSSSQSPFIGWSWFIDQTSDSLKTIGHTGSQGGFLCNYVTIPVKGIQFVILCNTPLDVNGMTNELMSLLKEYDYLD